jgi:hypothetical protein
VCFHRYSTDDCRWVRVNTGHRFSTVAWLQQWFGRTDDWPVPPEPTSGGSLCCDLGGPNLIRTHSHGAVRISPPGSVERADARTSVGRGAPGVGFGRCSHRSCHRRPEWCVMRVGPSASKCARHRHRAWQRLTSNAVVLGRTADRGAAGLGLRGCAIAAATS